MEGIKTMGNEIYKECPTYTTNNLTLRFIQLEDATELLRCYSDEKSVPLFNSDNCNGDDFHYTTIERMEEAIEFWQCSYEHSQSHMRLNALIH